ncbi:MAG: hypothetical protein LIO81_01705 [Clostridiales bacterium]|nr:hypothetical protein [Clostridiales bacterium]
MKKLFIIVAITCLTMNIAACGSAESNENNDLKKNESVAEDVMDDDGLSVDEDDLSEEELRIIRQEQGIYDEENDTEEGFNTSGASGSRDPRKREPNISVDVVFNDTITEEDYNKLYWIELDFGYDGKNGEVNYEEFIVMNKDNDENGYSDEFYLFPGAFDLSVLIPQDYKYEYEFTLEGSDELVLPYGTVPQVNTAEKSYNLVITLGKREGFVDYLDGEGELKVLDDLGDVLSGEYAESRQAEIESIEVSKAAETAAQQ